MKEHTVTELTVIRCNHNYNAWKAVRSEVGWAFAGTFRSFERPTAADAVASGALSGVPCKTVDITATLGEGQADTGEDKWHKAKWCSAK